MTNAQSKPSPKSTSKASPSKGSPSKKQNGKMSRLSSKSNKGIRYEMTAVGFPPLSIEAFCYTKITNNSEHNEGYTYRLRQMIDSDEEDAIVGYLRDQGFMGHFYRRQGYANQDRIRGDTEEYPRYWFVRVIPNDVESSVATRAEGIEAMTRFVQDPAFNRYPPQLVRNRDITAAPPESMNRHFMDADILSLMEHLFNEDYLNPDFASMFPDHAQMLFSNINLPPQAIDRYGFGANPANGPNGAYRPGFVPNRRIDEPDQEDVAVVDDNVADPVEENETSPDNNEDPANRAEDIVEEEPNRRAKRSRSRN